MVRHGRLRWFGHLKCKSVDDCVSSCRNVEVARVRCKGGTGRLGNTVRRMLWMGLVFGLSGQFLEVCEGTSYGQTSDHSFLLKKWMFPKLMMMM